MSIVKNRTFAYEISGYRDKRWIIDCVVHDEDASIAQGRALLKAKTYEEVKILRQRTGPTGFTVEKEIFHETAADNRNEPIPLSGDVESVPLCQDADAIYGLEARLAASRLMRRYLDREGITATELMHVWPYMRRFDNNASHLLGAAIHKIATSQAAALGIPARDRANTIQRWIAAGMERAREFDVVRRKIPFDLDNFDLSMRRLVTAIGEDSRRFGMMAQICYQLMGIGSLAGRLERMLEMAAAARAVPELYEALDGMIADALTSTTIIGEMLAGLANRAAALGRVADIVTGRFAPKPGERVDPILAGLARLHSEAGLNAGAEVLLDWLIHEIGKGKPLDRLDPKADEKLFQVLLPQLRDSEGQLLGGVRMQEAIGAHRLAQRQRVLRDMGMYDQANDLAKVWSIAMVERVAPLVA